MMRLSLALVLISSIWMIQGDNVNKFGGNLCKDLKGQCVEDNKSCHSTSIIPTDNCPAGTICCLQSDDETGGNVIKRLPKSNKDICPSSEFKRTHVCINGCTNELEAATFLSKLNPKIELLEQVVFNNKDYESAAINFVGIEGEGAKCKIKKEVQTWKCIRKSTDDKWDQQQCFAVGECYAIVKNDDTLEFKNPEFCLCPSPEFKRTHVCTKGCIDKVTAVKFLSSLNKPKTVVKQVVFNNKDYDNADINYIKDSSSQFDMKIEKEVQTWECRRLKGNDWGKKTCRSVGQCYAVVKHNGILELKEPDYCKCPHTEFTRKHVCDLCESENDARNFCNKYRKQEKNTKSCTVFKGPINKYKPSYSAENSEYTCNIDEFVDTWTCSRGGRGGTFKNCKKKDHRCTGMESALANGHYIEQPIDKKCKCKKKKNCNIIGGKLKKRKCPQDLKQTFSVCLKRCKKRNDKVCKIETFKCCIQDCSGKKCPEIGGLVTT